MQERKNKKTFTVMTDHELKNKSFYQRLWLVIRNLRISRRNWIEVLSFFLLMIDTEEWDIVWPDGRKYDLPFLDDLIDPEGRWFSNFTQKSEGLYEPASWSNKYELLRVLTLYLDVNYPKISKLVRK